MNAITSALSDGLASWVWSIDGWIVVAAILCGLATSLLGNFLVLRKMSMLGDAVSHAILPGLAAAFFISESRSSLPMFVGAVIVGVLTAVFTEWIRRVGRVDEGASMGVVFTSLFALGLVMIVQAADHVDLDAGCVLFGGLESTPLDKIDLFGYRIPRVVVTLGTVAIVNALFVLVMYKEWKISSFDPGTSTTMGFSAKWLHYVLMVLVAITAVASFEAVGNILVVAMFVVPPATAFLLTNRLAPMIVISGLLAVGAAITGHLSAMIVPRIFGFSSTLTSGMMAVTTGLFFVVALLISPRQGVLVKSVRRQLLSVRILADDVVAYLFRLDERSETRTASRAELKSNLLTSGLPLSIALRSLLRSGHLEASADQYHLTTEGEARARGLVRSHRLWEQYLVERAGVDQERIHDKAEEMEHFTDPDLRSRLDDETDRPSVDPHGTAIPVEESDD